MLTTFFIFWTLWGAGVFFVFDDNTHESLIKIFPNLYKRWLIIFLCGPLVIFARISWYIYNKWGWYWLHLLKEWFTS